MRVLRATSLIFLAGGLWVGLLASGATAAEPAAAEQAPAPALEQERRAGVPLHLSIGSGVFSPWDGDSGYNVSGTLHAGLGSDRFWVGGEFEYRHFEGRIKQNFRPDYNSFVLRFNFQYHPFPKAVVSPYMGIAVGVVLNKVDDNHQSGGVNAGDRVRSDVSGGFSMVGLAGLEIPLVRERVQVFAEGRLGNTSDLWKRKGGNYQMDQIGGVTGMGGLRFSF